MGIFGKKPEITPFPEPSKQRRNSEDCEIEIKNTAQGKKVKFKGKCNPEQIRAFARDNGVDFD